MFDSDYTVLELSAGESDEAAFQLTMASLDWPPEKRHHIPAGLDEMVPGPFLGAILGSIDLSKVSGSDAVIVMRAHNRLLSHDQRGLYTAMVEVAHSIDPDTTERSPHIEEYAPEEIGAALTYTRRTADDELTIAVDLDRRLPQVGEALDAGALDARKARVLCRDTAHLDDDTARAVTDEVLDEAMTITTGQLRARLRKLCIDADPEDAQARYMRSLSERKVVAEENAEGTAAFIISQASPEEVLAARNYVNRLAKRMKRVGEERNIDQLRADVALALLKGELGDQSLGSGGSVTLTASLAALAELESAPGELGGYGPVIAEIARKVAREQQSGDWNAVITDEETGEPLHVVSVRRRPSSKQLRKIKALMPTCSFPGCRMPATESDIDHITDHAAGGPTTVRNQAPLCRRHHMAKHRAGWRYRKVGRCVLEWTSPLGHRYRVRRPP